MVKSKSLAARVSALETFKASEKEHYTVMTEGVETLEEAKQRVLSHCGLDEFPDDAYVMYLDFGNSRKRKSV